MPITVRIPTPLQKLTGEQPEVSASGRTVQDLLQDLDQRYPGLKERLCDPQGRLRRFVNIYVNEEDIRFLKQEATPLKDGDEVSIIPAIAGGSDARRLSAPAIAGGSDARRLSAPAIAGGSDARRLSAPAIAGGSA